MDMMNMLRSIEVTIISAEDLRLNRRPIKKNAIVTVQTNPPNSYQSTSIDKDGGNYPSWNEKLYLQLSHNVKFLHVEVQCKTALEVKLIGVANIPVSDFIGDHIPPYYLHFLSYRLREQNGERNGIVNLSVRVKQQPQEYVGKSLQHPSSVAAAAQASTNNMSYNCGIPMENNYRGGIAMGIPVASYGL